MMADGDGSDLRVLSLTTPGGDQISVAPGETVVLGRAHALGMERAYVSRKQASVTNDGYQAVLRVEGPNACVLFRAEDGMPPLKLEQGETCVLADGDTMALYGKRQRVAVRITDAPYRLAPLPAPADAESPPLPLAHSPSVVRSPTLGPSPRPRAPSDRSVEPPDAKRARAAADAAESSDEAGAIDGADGASERLGAPAGAPAPATAEPTRMLPLAELAERPMVWSVYDGQLLVGSTLPAAPGAPPRVALALFDLEHTLVRWLCAGFPRSLAEIALPAAVVARLVALDAEGFALAIACNQGGIKGAFDGTQARLFKAQVARIAAALAPAALTAVCATRMAPPYRKPAVGMVRHLCARLTAAGNHLDLARSFYAGVRAAEPLAPPPAADADVNAAFARAAGLRLWPPEEAFGFASARGGGLAEWSAAPAAAATNATPPARLSAVGALVGGYLARPALLLLCGPPGAGKSTFGSAVLAGAAEGAWALLCQDTAAACGTKPGSRARVEAAARRALGAGRSVVVDRTHLTRAQRAGWCALGREAGAACVHVVQLATPPAECERRVRTRVGHPAGLQGAAAVGVARSLAHTLEPPDAAAEGFELVLRCADGAQADRVAALYAAALAPPAAADDDTAVSARAYGSHDLLVAQTHGAAARAPCAIPALGWGTYEVAAGAVSSALRACRAASAGRAAVLVDCAPTYANQPAVGRALDEWRAEVERAGAGGGPPRAVVCGKLSKAVVKPAHVRAEARASLAALGLPSLDVLLLHWPSACVEARTLAAVWAAMGALVAEGAVAALGVCNCTVGVLELLPTPPALVQVERHPLLPQWELVAYCALRGILVQAHSPLGGRRGRAALLAHPQVVAVARACGRSPAQVVLCWNLQHGCAVVTRAAEAHAAENAAVVGAGAAPLSAAHMRALDALSEGAGGETRFVSPPFMHRPGAVYSWT